MGLVWVLSSYGVRLGLGLAVWGSNIRISGAAHFFPCASFQFAQCFK